MLRSLKLAIKGSILHSQWHFNYEKSHTLPVQETFADLFLISFIVAANLMVLFASSTTSCERSGRSAVVHRDITFQTLSASSIHDSVLALCKACQSKVMSSIPFTAFSAARIRETQHNMKISNIKKDNEYSSKYFNATSNELSPLKYNSKLMNSIWGIYNRYSPHNVKKVNDASAFSGEMQQSAALSSTKTESVLNLPSSALDKVWTAINVSQSH